jgi:Kef-type K+ transport system membrane component KefB
LDPSSLPAAPVTPFQQQQDRKQTKASLIGFYLSCAGVALGTTVGAAGFLWYESKPWLVFGVIATVTCTGTCYRSLSRMRR